MLQSLPLPLQFDRGCPQPLWILMSGTGCWSLSLAGVDVAVASNPLACVSTFALDLAKKFGVSLPHCVLNSHPVLSSVSRITPTVKAGHVTSHQVIVSVGSFGKPQRWGPTGLTCCVAVSKSTLGTHRFDLLCCSLKNQPIFSAASLVTLPAKTEHVASNCLTFGARARG